VLLYVVELLSVYVNFINHTEHIVVARLRSVVDDVGYPLPRVEHNQLPL
jgi:hypothetical protein